MQGELQNVVLHRLEKPIMWYKVTDYNNIERMPEDFNMTQQLVVSEVLTPRSTVDVELLILAMPADTPSNVKNLIGNPIGEWVYENDDKTIVYVQAY